MIKCYLSSALHILYLLKRLVSRKVDSFLSNPRNLFGGTVFLPYPTHFWPHHILFLATYLLLSDWVAVIDGSILAVYSARDGYLSPKVKSPKHF